MIAAIFTRGMVSALAGVVSTSEHGVVSAAALVMAAGKKRMIYTKANVVSAGEHSVISALASIMLTAGE